MVENLLWVILIHSADTQSRRPVVIIVFTQSVGPPVRPHFSKSKKQNKFQVKTMFTTGETVDLAMWIIDDTLSCYILQLKR